MNLFDNIIQSSVGNFLGTKPNVPSTPSFTTPQAPRTLSYTQPTVTPKPKISQGVRNGGFAPGYEDTVDETQSPVFKAVQGAANLFTGVQKRLGETVQSDIDRRQQQEDKEGMEFAQYLADQGYNEEQIMSGLDSLKSEGKLTVSDNFIQSFNERLVGGIANRMGEVQRTTERLSNEPLTTRMTTGIPSYAGDVVGTAFEPVAAALSPVVQKVIEKTGQTQNIEEVGKWWEGVRQSNPNFADALEGVLNVSQLAPLSPKVTAPIKSGIKTIGTKTLQTAEKIAPNLTNQAKKLTSQAEMGFRKQAEDIAVPKLSEMGMREKQKVTGNVIETKPGLFKKEELVRSPQEALAIEEVSRMLKEGKIKKGGTELQKSTAISDEITGLAEALKGRLDNTPNPVSIPKQEVEYFINDLAANIKKNPIMVGDMQESAYKIIQNLKDKLTKDTYTPSDLLEIRKQLDSDVQAFKGETVFDPKIENAFSSTLKEFRQGINNKVAELVPDAQVRSFLDRQSALYTAKDNVDLKWSKQANTTIGRILSKIQSTTGIPRTEIIELATAGGLLGASTLAPIITPIVVGGAAIVGGKKAIGAILSPKNKVKLANILTKIDEAIKKNPKDAELLKAKELFSNPTKNGGITTNIRSSSNNGSSNSQPVKPIVTPPSNAKQQGIKPRSTTTNVFGETIDKPSNKKGGFIKIPEIGKKVEPLIEEAKRTDKVDSLIKYFNERKSYQWDLLREYKDGIKASFQSDSAKEVLSKLGLKGDVAHITGIGIQNEFKGMGLGKNMFLDFYKRHNEIKPLDYITTGGQTGEGAKFFKSLVNEGFLEEIQIPNGKKGVFDSANLYKATSKLKDSNPIDLRKVQALSEAGTQKAKKEIYELFGVKVNNQSKSIVKNPLVEEARKYKSAEEFIKAQGHGRKIIPIKGESMGQNTYKLSEVLDNKKLFEKYPELSGINVKFGWKPIGKEKMAIEGKNIVVTKSQYEIVPDTKKLAEIDKKLNELYKKDELGTITKEEYKTAEKLQQEYADIENGKGSSGIRLTDEGMRSLFHEIQHGKQALKGYNVKMQEDFLSKNAIGDSKDYYQNLFEIDARRAEKKYKTVDELIDIYKQAHKSIPVKNPLVDKSKGIPKK